MKKQPYPAQIDSLLRQVRDAGVVISAGAAERLELYCKEMLDWSDRAGLISPHDEPHLVTKHIAASLSPLLILPPEPNQRWIDVGTGGGLPGMVIALCRPDLNITLIDSKHKKTIFLDRIKTLASLDKVTVLEGRVEKLASEGSATSTPPYEVVLMRAVTALDKSLPLIDKITIRGSQLITFKGPTWQEEVTQAQTALTNFNWQLQETEQTPWAKPKLLHLIKS
jgi:16S rRNA (guanine527-N7)-methyltransferase